MWKSNVATYSSWARSRPSSTRRSRKRAQVAAGAAGQLGGDRAHRRRRVEQLLVGVLEQQRAEAQDVRGSCRRLPSPSVDARDAQRRRRRRARRASTRSTSPSAVSTRGAAGAGAAGEVQAAAALALGEVVGDLAVGGRDHVAVVVLGDRAEPVHVLDRGRRSCRRCAAIRAVGLARRGWPGACGCASPPGA